MKLLRHGRSLKRRGVAMLRPRLGMLLGLAVVACFSVSACGSSGGGVTRATTMAAPDAVSREELNDLRIGPLDKLKINVFGVEALSQEYQVDQTGMLKMPLLGPLDVKGYTPSGLGDMLALKLGEKYIQHADVSVVVTESAGAQVTVEGTVKKPGLFPVRGKLTLLQAVAMAGGPDEGANIDRVLVFRTIEGQRRAAAFDLRDIRRGKAEDPQVYGADVVVVDGSKTASAYKEFLKSIPLLTMFVLY